MDPQARAPNSEESKGLALFGHLTGKPAGYGPTPTPPKTMPAVRDKSKSLAAMFPTGQQSNNGTPSVPAPYPTHGSHVSPPGSQLKAPTPPGSHVSPPPPGSHVTPPPAGSHVTPLPVKEVAKSGPPAGQVQASPSAASTAMLLEAVVNGSGYRIRCQHDKPGRLLVGREVQPLDVWEKLVPCETSRSSISREQFEIREAADSPTGFILANLSSSGTILNGQFIQKESPVEAGDSITIGLDQSQAALQLAAKNPHMPRKPALQMYFITPQENTQGGSVTAILECVFIAGRTQSQLAQLPKASRCLQGNGAAGPRAALLRIGRAMQLQTWWETLFQDDRLVNGISREHFQVRAGEGGRPTLHNISPIGTLVNTEPVLQNQSRPLTSEDTITILNKHDNGKLVTFRFVALDTATGRALFEARKETVVPTPVAKSSLAPPVQGQTGGMLAQPSQGNASMMNAARSFGTEMSFGQVPQQSSRTLQQVSSAAKFREAAPQNQTPTQNQPSTQAATQNQAPNPNQSLDDMLKEAEALGTVEGEASWRLRCSSAYNQDPAKLAQFGLELKHFLTPQLGSSSIKVGRMVQAADFWTKLMPYDWARNTISRECFEVSYDNCDEHGLQFAFTNLSSGGTLVNRKRVHSTAKLRVGDTMGVGGVQPPSGQGELLPVLEFEIICTQTDFGSQRNSVESGTQASNSSQGVVANTVVANTTQANKGAVQPVVPQSSRAEEPFSTSSLGFGERVGRSPSPSTRHPFDQPFQSQTSPGQTPFSQLVAQAVAKSPRQSPPQPVNSPRLSPRPSNSPRPSIPMSEAPLLSRQSVPTPQLEAPLSGPLSQAPLLSKHNMAENHSPRSSQASSRRHSQMAEEFIAGTVVSESPLLNSRTPYDAVADSFGQWPSEQSTGRGSDVRMPLSEQSTGDTFNPQANNYSQHPESKSAQTNEQPFAAVHSSAPQARFPQLLEVTGGDMPTSTQQGREPQPTRADPGREPQPTRADPKGQEDQQLVYALCPPIASFTGLPENSQIIGPTPSIGTLALTKLEGNESQMWMLESSIDSTGRAFESGQLSSGEARDALAQLEAKLVRLQADGIDSVVLSEMTSRSAEEARELKRELTEKAEALQNRLQTLFRKLQGT